jgi:hypothetical protein
MPTAIRNGGRIPLRRQIYNLIVYEGAAAKGAVSTLRQNLNSDGDLDYISVLVEDEPQYVRIHA